MSNAALKGKNRGNTRGETPDKRPLEADYNLNDNDIALMKEAFELLDTTGTGVIDKSDLEGTLGAMKSDCQIGARMLDDLLNSDEPITLDVFIKHLQNSRGDKNTKEGVQKVFGLIDNGEGMLTADTLKSMLRELGESISDEQVQETIDKLAPETKCISMAQFQSLMRPGKAR
ncbi:hypothetical protein SteCoe_12967 [Stentor coeruleus]|uniref:EF-hand domain-containing protein n=1 Tax=Stentor coeruleus TaxID=5963 RepID=A0A1R2C9L7_9CILI|nr:hypothetical protein SteCoe_12967 [Stentor coeruleus]